MYYLAGIVAYCTVVLFLARFAGTGSRQDEMLYRSLHREVAMSEAIDPDKASATGDLAIGWERVLDVIRGPGGDSGE